MSVESTPLTIQALRELLLKAPRLARSPGERTIFALGGNGYYDNPASDLLAFFLAPDGEHGFGPLFLRVFLQCIGVDSHGLSLEGIGVQREARTAEGKRIDLFIQGLDWTLVIENKIRHHQNNPVEAYASHAQRYRGGEKKRFFAVLSPGGGSGFSPEWCGVSYKQYLTALRQALTPVFFDSPYSKWHVFAREFILHLENEIYSPLMEEEQFRFVEAHLAQIEQLKNLPEAYHRSLLDRWRDRLTALLPTQEFRVFDENWALKCHDQQDRWSLALQSPAHPVGNSQHKFRLVLYLGVPTPAQLQRADEVLVDLARRPEEDWYYWLKTSGYDTSAEAMADLGRMADLISELCPGRAGPPPDR